MNITRKFLNFQLTAGIVAHGTFQNFSGLEIIHALYAIKSGESEEV